MSKRKTKPRTPKKVHPLIGRQFRSPIADCNPLWEVKSSRGRGAFICEVVNEPFEIDGKTFDGEYAGRRQTFGVEEIERSLRVAEFWAKSRREHEDFYDSLAFGEIVHYDDGFGNFVRCEVVTAANLRKGFDHPCVEDGEKCLKELALVGNWRDYDLRSDSYHMRGVREARLFKPNASCIWENPDAACRKKHSDPSKLEPLAVVGQQELFG